MKTKRKKTGGRKKGEPTKVVRVPKYRPDFASEAIERFSEDIPKMVGFVSGCNYVWDKHINKLKTIHPMP